MTPLPCCSRGNNSRALRAPRSLKLPVRCRYSSLQKIFMPVASESGTEGGHGDSITWPRIRFAAASMSSNCTARLYWLRREIARRGKVGAGSHRAGRNLDARGRRGGDTAPYLTEGERVNAAYQPGLMVKPRGHPTGADSQRSEERRVGKECR